MAIAFAALAIAVPAALFVLWPLLRRGHPKAATPVNAARAELEAEKALALRAIRELTLDHEAGHLADDDYAELGARYEARAAAILRQLDALGPEPPSARAPGRAAGSATTAGAGFGGPVPWSRQPVILAVASVGLVVFGVVIGILAVRFTTPAPPDSQAEAGPEPLAMPGGPGARGPLTDRGGGGPPRPIPKGMLEGMLQAARASLNAGRLQEAIAAYQAVLKREPNNVDALTHFGLVLAMADHPDRALEYFDRALAADPDYPEALSYSAQVRFELKQDYAGAIAAWERFAKVVPNAAARDEALARIKEAKSRLGKAPPPAPAPGTAGASSPKAGSKP